MRLGLSGPEQGAVAHAATQLAGALERELGGPDRDILGPAPGVFARLQGRYREQLLIKGDLSRGQKAWVADCCRALKDVHRDLDVMMDVDPVGLW